MIRQTIHHPLIIIQKDDERLRGVCRECMGVKNCAHIMLYKVVVCVSSWGFVAAKMECTVHAIDLQRS